MHPKINCYGLAGRNAALATSELRVSALRHSLASSPGALTGRLIVCQVARGYAPIILHPFVIPVALVMRRRVR